MKKLWSFLTTVVPRDGFYYPYAWHAPINETLAAELAKAHAAERAVDRSKAMASGQQVWV